MIVSLDSFDCKKGHQIKNVVFSIIINSNSEASMKHKIVKKEIAKARGYYCCAKTDKSEIG